MQTIQIDKLGAVPFDGTTLVTPGTTPGVTISQDAAENQILIEIAAGVPVGRFDLRSIVNIAPTNSLALLSASIGGDFLAPTFTSGGFFIVGPDNPTGSGTEQSSLIGTLAGSSGILVGGSPPSSSIPRWFPVQHLLGIVTDPADPGPYRVILLVEERPTLPLEAAFSA